MSDSEMSAAYTVVRVAYICSDVLIDSQHHSGSPSSFTKSLRSLSKSSPRKLTLLHVKHAADLGSYLLYHKAAGLLSVTCASDSRILTRLLSYFAELTSTPIVLHIAVDGDLSDVLSLRSVTPFFLHSTNACQAHDNALVASKIALSEKAIVVHAFQIGMRAESVTELAEEKIRSFLLDTRRFPSKSRNSSTYSNGFNNGVANGHANGKANGYSNGHANGVNGSLDGTSGHNGVDTSSNDGSELSSSPPIPSLPDNAALVSLFEAYEAASLSTVALTRRAVLPLLQRGSPDPHTVFFVLGSSPAIQLDGVLWFEVALLSPLLPSKILRLIPSSVKRIVVLEQLHNWNLKWMPLYLEIMTALQQRDESTRPAIFSGVLGDPSSVSQMDGLKLLQNITVSPTNGRLRLGKPRVKLEADFDHTPPPVPEHEASYTKILQHLFKERLEFSNSPENVRTQGALATTPEFALGRVRRRLEERDELVKAVQTLVQSSDIPSALHVLLTKWLMVRDDQDKSGAVGQEILSELEANSLSHSSVPTIFALRAYFQAVSRWIIGSDAWSYDLGASGLHHLITSGLNVNILILDTVPYSYRNTVDPLRRKRDIGLYAMNHGDVFVASVAIYSSYTQVLQALAEADRFPGPSVVLAYLPYQNENTPALQVLKETKLAVDAGYWPLYRWNPEKEKENKEPFSLDSDTIKKELSEFLDRQNHLSQLTRSKPSLATELVHSLGESVQEARRKRAQKAYEELVSNFTGGNLLVLYASDGGAAEKKAKRLALRGKARGLNVTVQTMDSASIEDVAKEEYVVFVTSVAGQGEPPQNGRKFFKSLNAAVAKMERPFSSLKYSAFGMGDSHYWPRPEDAHYYNKAGKDLDARLTALGGTRFADLGLGDDQDEDGPETGYRLWEPFVWKALSVDNIEVLEAEPDPITNEHMKIASNYLRGTISEGLEDTTTGALAPSDTQLTKFHGIYQQDDRDIRDERQVQGAEPAYSFMIRVRMPGGVCTPGQWLQMDKIADEYGNSTFKITTRQTFQFHGVIKRHLKQTIKEINRALLDTLAACGDVNR